LISFSIGRPFKSCNKPVSFGDKELDSGIVASQKTRVPEFDMQRMERDTAVQAADAGKDGCSQTAWNRPVNKTTQVRRGTASRMLTHCTPLLRLASIVAPARLAILAH
jgi:hypothetical protein